MKIEVTAEDIRRGKREKGLLCPVARAVKRATGKPWWIDGEVAYEENNEYLRYPLPPRCRQFISNFDNKAPVKPFSFNLRIPNAN